MTDDRNKSSPRNDSVARPTARDVPFTRGAGSESEPAPRGQRPGQLPRDPTYEAELAQVELAVLRDPQPRDDPSTKQGGRRAQQPSAAQPPESITPESPGTLARREGLVRSPEPPSSAGRAVASGTLLSVGAVDPRGKTERTLETPRMFISQQQGSEAYFKPGKIPAVTVHQTIETETIKLSDSIDPRRAKTIPRLDRAALAQLAEMEGVPDSEASFAVSQPAPSSLDLSSAQSPRWNQEQWDAEEASLRSDGDRQIHASLSPFREQAASSFSLDGAPTRQEPLAGRRSDAPEPPSSVIPDTSAVPTHRDLPVHRIEASQPPPPPAASSPVSQPQSLERFSEGPAPTTASIAAEEPEARRVWINYVAFVGALLLAVALGLYLTRGSDEQAGPPQAPPADEVRDQVTAPPPAPAPAPAPETPARAQVQQAPAAGPPSPRRVQSPAPPATSPAAAPAAAPPHKSTNPKAASPKAARETIF